MWRFADEETLHYFCCVQNIEDFRSKEIRQPNGAQTFQRLAHVERTYRIEVKPVYQSLESLNAKVVYFLLCVVFWMLKSISVTRPISRVF